MMTVRRQLYQDHDIKLQQENEYPKTYFWSVQMSLVSSSWVLSLGFRSQALEHREMFGTDCKIMELNPVRHTTQHRH